MLQIPALLSQVRSALLFLSRVMIVQNAANCSMTILCCHLERTVSLQQPVKKDLCENWSRPSSSGAEHTFAAEECTTDIKRSAGTAEKEQQRTEGMELLYRSYSCISSRATKCFLVTSHVQLRQAVGEHVSIEKWNRPIFLKSFSLPARNALIEVYTTSRGYRETH